MVRTLDPAGVAVSGACLELWTGAAAGARGSLVVGPRCGGQRPGQPRTTPGDADGLADASVGFSDIPAGDYLLVVSALPLQTGPPAWAPAPDVVVAVTAGTVGPATVTLSRVVTLVLRIGDGAYVVAPGDRPGIGDRSGIEPPSGGDAGGRLPACRAMTRRGGRAGWPGVEARRARSGWRNWTMTTLPRDSDAPITGGGSVTAGRHGLATMRA